MPCHFTGTASYITETSILGQSLLRVDQQTHDSIAISCDSKLPGNYTDFKVYAGNYAQGECEKSSESIKCTINGLDPGSEYTIVLYGCKETLTETSELTNDTAINTLPLGEGCTEVANTTAKTRTVGKPKPKFLA